MARGVCTLVSIVVFAALASSAAAGPSGGAAPMPSKRELREAGQAMAARMLVRPAVSQAPRTVRSARRSSVALSALESGLLARVNSVRRQHGLRSLALSRGLTAAADYHSKQMVQHGFFEHESRGGGAFWKRIERFYASSGFRRWEVGENLAYGSPDLTANATVRMWMNSPGHRENLLSRRWREIGLGAIHVAMAGGEFAGGPATVITADFGVRLS